MPIGNTSLKNTGGIYFKCEYENPTGSFKDRGIYHQVVKAHRSGYQDGVISSSGNAAISAAYFCGKSGIKLTVFVTPDINKQKLLVLNKTNVTVIKTKSPNSDSFLFAQKNNAYDFRQSKDDTALIGYKQIAFEIIKELPEPDSIFIPVSSGTAMVGIMNGFRELGLRVPVHIVQTASVHPVASLLDKDFNPEVKSLSDAIISRHPPRKNEILRIIKENNGSGWVISDEEMIKTRKWLIERGLDCSYEGIAALAAFWKAKRKGYSFKKPVVILSGKYY